MAVGPLYFEDLSVGRRFVSESLTVSAEAIKAFGAAFDPQPFHLDETAAARSLFKGLAASGWHTAALTMRLLVTSGLPIEGGVIGASVEVSWPRPTRPGDTLKVASEVIEARPSRSKPAQGWIKVAATTLNQDDEAVQLLIASLVVPVRGG